MHHEPGLGEVLPWRPEAGPRRARLRCAGERFLPVAIEGAERCRSFSAQPVAVHQGQGDSPGNLVQSVCLADRHGFDSCRHDYFHGPPQHGHVVLSARSIAQNLLQVLDRVYIRDPLLPALLLPLAPRPEVLHPHSARCRTIMGALNGHAFGRSRVQRLFLGRRLHQGVSIHRDRLGEVRVERPSWEGLLDELSEIRVHSLQRRALGLVAIADGGGKPGCTPPSRREVLLVAGL